MNTCMRYMEKLLEGVEVEWKPLGEVLIANIGGGTPSKAEQTYWSGKIPWASVGDLSIENAFVEQTRNHITDEGLKKSSSNLIPKGSLIVAIKISPGKVKIAGSDIAINQDLRGLIVKDCILNKYLYYYLNIISFVGNGTIVKSVTSKYLEKIEIPIPPLRIQDKIVQILDTFTALTAELTAELTARKKQYNYYREKLLQFGPEVEWKTLGEVAEYSKGRTKLVEVDNTNYVGVDNLIQNKLGKTNSDKLPKSVTLAKYDKEDILIGNIRPYLKKIWYSDRFGGANGDVLVIHKVDKLVISRYLYYILSDDRFFSYNMNYSKGAKMPRGNKDKIMEYSFPIPSLSEQERIVSILDKFDALTHSISEGLPREIELRQKQYEYYRDMLLNFPKPPKA